MKVKYELLASFVDLSANTHTTELGQMAAKRVNSQLEDYKEKLEITKIILMKFVRMYVKSSTSSLLHTVIFVLCRCL